MKKAIVSVLATLALLSALIPLTAWQNTPTLGVLPDSGPNLPATCVVGQIYFKTTATTGLNQCATVNTWTAIGGSGSGTVNAGTANQVAFYPASAAAVSGSTGLTYDQTHTLTIGVAGGGNAILALSGNTSGTSTFTANAIAGTTGNPVVMTNALMFPQGTAALPAFRFNDTFTDGLYSSGTNALTWAINGSVPVFTLNSNTSVKVVAGMVYGFTTSVNDSTTGLDTGVSRSAANVIALGNGTAADESALLRSNQCRVTGDITLPVNTATTVCSWSLPAVAKAWAWQCEIPWVISAGSGTNTLAIIANPSQTPTGATNGFAEILTTNTGTATEATTAISASGATTLLTSGTITPAATVFSSRTSGTLLASGTAGTFTIQMTAAGTTATAAAKAGSTCQLY